MGEMINSRQVSSESCGTSVRLTGVSGAKETGYAAITLSGVRIEDSALDQQREGS